MILQSSLIAHFVTKQFRLRLAVLPICLKISSPVTAAAVVMMVSCDVISRRQLSTSYRIFAFVRRDYTPGGRPGGRADGRTVSQVN